MLQNFRHFPFAIKAVHFCFTSVLHKLAHCKIRPISPLFFFSYFLRNMFAVTVANLADELQMKIDLSTKDLDSGQQMSFQE